MSQQENSEQQFKTDRELLENIYQLQIITFRRLECIEEMLVQLGSRKPSSAKPKELYEATVDIIDTEMNNLSFIEVSYPGRSIPPHPIPKD